MEYKRKLDEKTHSGPRPHPRALSGPQGGRRPAPQTPQPQRRGRSATHANTPTRALLGSGDEADPRT